MRPFCFQLCYIRMLILRIWRTVAGKHKNKSGGKAPHSKMKKGARLAAVPRLFSLIPARLTGRCASACVLRTNSILCVQKTEATIAADPLTCSPFAAWPFAQCEPCSACTESPRESAPANKLPRNPVHAATGTAAPTTKPQTRPQRKTHSGRCCQTADPCDNE